MGKWLYNTLYTIFSQLGTYAFPNGKPQIDWGGGNPPVIPPCTVSKTIGTGLSSTGGDSDVAFGDPLEVTIAITNNLYIVDEDNIVVTMGGSPVAGAWNASTMKVTIAAVTGNVVINVPSMTYADVDGGNNQLAFMLDCKNRGGQAGHWIDLIGGVDFALTNVTEADTGMVFNGSTSKGEVASGGLNVPYDNATIEAVIDVTDLTTTPSQRYPILANTVDGAAAATLRTGSNNILFVACSSNGTNVAAPQNMAFHYNVANRSFGSTRDTVVIDGIEPENPRTQEGVDVHDYAVGLSSSFAVGHGNINSTNYYFKGKILAIRVYKTKLTAQQIIYNHNIDKKRFNLA